MDDDLCSLIEPLLPPWPEKAPRPRPVPDRQCLQGILYVQHNDIAWQLLPREPGFATGQTCWRRLERWQKAGTFDRLHRIPLVKPNPADELDWSRVGVDGSHAARKKGGAGTGPSPVDRRKTGRKHHVICDGRGTPLNARGSGRTPWTSRSATSRRARREPWRSGVRAGRCVNGRLWTAGGSRLNPG
ncbi:transposase [Streptomyces sp. NPDC088254]|uniref:transposase n=1 Tax=Streptomyces sp. NPDC088254 TaxID=3365847 RepID=UPI0037FE9E70